MAEALRERQDAYGLQRISLSAGAGSAPPDPVRFCREVLRPAGLTGSTARSIISPPGGHCLAVRRGAQRA
jgi:hypothetical protein